MSEVLDKALLKEKIRNPKDLSVFLQDEKGNLKKAN
jgi:hypothetical protein